MDRCVEITFDCLPLRSISRLDIPIDASPAFRRRCEKIKAAMEKHGAHNSYYLHNARCAFQLTNSPETGRIDFRFEGTLLTGDADEKSESCELEVELIQETCDWLTEPVVKWFHESVERAVMVEFDRYIKAGDLEKTKDRMQRIQAESDSVSGYLGMYL